MTLDTEQEAREQAIAHLQKKRKFFVDLTAYVTVNGVLWLIWALADRSTDDVMPWPAWVSAIWGFFLLMDALKVFGRWSRVLHRPITEAEIDREIRRSAHGV